MKEQVAHGSHAVAGWKLEAQMVLSIDRNHSSDKKNRWIMPTVQKCNAGMRMNYTHLEDEGILLGLGE